MLAVGCAYRRIADEEVFVWTPPAISLRTPGKFFEALKLAGKTLERDKKQLLLRVCNIHCSAAAMLAPRPRRAYNTL